MLLLSKQRDNARKYADCLVTLRKAIINGFPKAMESEFVL
jgi:hypothetical protein